MALTKVTGHVVKPDTNIQFHNTKSTGIVTFTHTSNATSSTTGALQITGGVGIVKDLHVGGNVTVGGTLTYDDVTNIDSLGIITARGGINVSGGNVTITNDLDVDGHTELDNLSVAGVTTFTNEVKITPSNSSSYTTHLNYNNNGTNFISCANSGATHFRNSSSGGTAMIVQGSTKSVDIDSTLRHLDDTDTLMEFGTNTISFDTAGTERLRTTEVGRVGIGTTNPVAHLEVAAYQNVEVLRLRDRHNNKYLTIQGGGTPNRMVIDSYEGGGGGAAIDLASNGDTKVRIDSNGRVLIGTTTEGTVDSDDLTIGTTGNTGITIRSGTTHNGAIHFSDATSGVAEYAGFIDYDHNIDVFVMGSGSQRFLSADADAVVTLGKPNFGGPSRTIIYGNAGGIRKNSLLVLNATASVTGRGAGVAVGGNTDPFGSFYGQKNGNADSAGGDVFLESIGDINFTGGGDMTTFSPPTPQLIIKSDGKLLFGGITSARSGFFNTAAQFNPHFQIEGAGDADDPGRVTSIIYNSTTTGGPTLLFGKTSSGSLAGTGAVSNHHSLGLITFQGMVGGQFTQGATISAAVSGTPGDNDLPTILSFGTCADDEASASERLRIEPDGDVIIKTNDVALSGSGTLRINSGSTSGELNLDGGASNHGGEINLLGGSNGGRIIFRTGQGAGQQSEKMRLDENGRLLIGNGNVTTQAGDAKLIVYASERLHPAIKADCIDGGTNRANGFTLLADNYQGDESICNFGISYSGAGLVLSRGVKVSNTTDDVYLSSIDSYAVKPSAFKLDDSGDIIFLNTNTSATTTTDNPVTLYERLRIKATGEVHISDRNSSNTGDHFFQAGAFGIRMEDTGGYNRWNIERNYGGYQSDPIIHLSAQGVVGINTASPGSALHVRGAGGIRIDTLSGTPIASSTNVVTDGGGNPYLSGTPWYTTNGYTYNTSNNPHMDYYWIKIVQYMGYSAICYIEYMAHSDSNYPRSVHGRIDVAKYANSSISISHQTLTPSTGITPQVVIDSNQRVWVKMNGIQWNSDFRFRVIYSEDTTINTDFTVGTDNTSSTVGRLLNQDAQPLNVSGIIEPGATMRWSLSNSNPPKYWSGGNFSNTADYGDSAQDYGAGQMTFYRVQTRGRVNIKANWNDHALNVESNSIDVNKGSQPVTAIFKSQKNTVAEFNRMYTQGILIQFRQNNDARGYINNSGTTTSLVQSGSDERLKKNFEDWTEEVLPYFKALKPKKFNFKEESDDAKKTKGYIAQDNLEAFPEAYPLNPNDDRYWFANSEMVPYLMKALQEEIVKREEIEAKYNALEARISALESDK